MAILRDSESQLINLAPCWVLIRFIATIIRVKVRVRVRVRVSDIRVKIFRVKVAHAPLNFQGQQTWSPS